MLRDRPVRPPKRLRFLHAHSASQHNAPRNITPFMLRAT
jgi:hypothetical protein